MDYLLVKRLTPQSEPPQYNISQHSVMLNAIENEKQSVYHEGCDENATFVIANAGDQAYIQYVIDEYLVEELSHSLLCKIPGSINRIIV